MNLPAFLCVAALAAALPVSAAPATPKPAPATPAPAPPADATKVFAPTDLDALREALGQTVTVEGTVVASGENKSKTVRYLNFTKNYKESLGLVFFANKVGDNFSIDGLSTWVGKKVRATGKLSDYNGSLQISIEQAEQLKEVP